jgi:adenylate cyclase class 2
VAADFYETEPAMKLDQEIEIKFRVDDARTLTRFLRTAGFHRITPRTHEMNSLYDLPRQKLRRKGELLRLRKYGNEWTLTYKSKDKNKSGRHKTRVEVETKVENGAQMNAILNALGYEPSLRYEKFRAEWGDGKGRVVVDQTPIGNFGEIEGPPRWIDRTARALEIRAEDYITESYAELFFTWKHRTKSPAKEMTFQAIRTKVR